MIYIDTSSLLKLVITDRFSTFVELAIASEPVVIVSSLGELETRVQLRGLAKGGIVRTSRIQRIGEKLALNLKSAPELFGMVPAWQKLFLPGDSNRCWYC